eukprot:scaffold926_cov150-Chaetoceros_neogracile.AAC.8
MAAYVEVDLQAWNLEKLLSFCFDDKKACKEEEKVEDLDNDLAAMTHDEGEEGIDDINANCYGNDNGNAHTSGCVG